MRIAPPDSDDVRPAAVSFERSVTFIMLARAAHRLYQRLMRTFSRRGGREGKPFEPGRASFSEARACLQMFDTSHFAPLFRQLAREKPRRSTTMPAFFAGDLTENRRKLLGRTFEDTP